jgi:hypothetical protein
MLIHKKSNPQKTNRASLSGSFTPKETGEKVRFRIEVYDKYGHIVGYKVIRINLVS